MALLKVDILCSVDGAFIGGVGVTLVMSLFQAVVSLDAGSGSIKRSSTVISVVTYY